MYFNIFVAKNVYHVERLNYVGPIKEDRFILFLGLVLQCKVYVYYSEGLSILIEASNTYYFNY